MDTWKAAVIGTAIIWAAELISVSIVLAGTGYFAELLPILAGGAAANIIIIAGPRQGKSCSDNR